MSHVTRLAGFLLLFCLLSSGQARAQFKHFTSQDGLPQGIFGVTGIVAYDGKMLLGTQGGGFARYDGLRWEVWNTDNGLPQETSSFGDRGAVTGFLRDTDGSFLLACFGGVVHWDGTDSFTIEGPRPPTGTEYNVTALAKATDGTLWISTSQGVARKENGIWSWVPGLPNAVFGDLHIATDGAVWTGTQFDGLFRFNGSTWDRFGMGIGFSSSWIYHIDEDSRGNIWISTPAGAHRYDGTVWQAFTQADGLAGDAVGQVYEDSGGDFWFVIRSYGITHWDGEKWTSYGVAEGLLHETVTGIYEDPWGGLWIGSGQGASRFDRSGWKYFTEVDGLSGARTYAILEDAAGDLWVGGLNGTSRWDGSAWHVQSIVPVPPGSTLEAVLDIDQDASGRMWFSTNNGIALLEGSNWTYVRSADGLSSDVVQTGFEDSKGRMWFGTNEGVSRFDASGWTHYSRTSGLPQLVRMEFVDIAEDGDGRIWVVGAGGVVRWDDAAGWEQVDLPDDCGFPPCGAQAVEAAPDESLWFAGTRRTGVYRLDGSGWTRITPSDGLLSDEITDLMFDDSGAMWFSSPSGLGRLKDGIFGSYTAGDGGLPVNDLNGLYQDSRGTLWISGAGLTRRHLDRVAPVAVQFTGPPPASSDRDQTVTWETGFKEGDGTRFQTSFDGGSWSELTTFKVWTQYGLADGDHELLIRAIDRIGNVQTEPTQVLFTVDATAPLPKIVSPAPGEPVRGNVEIVGTASDPRFVDYIVDVRKVNTESWTTLHQGTEPVVDGTLATWNTISLDEGDYEIRVRVNDDVGLSGPAVTDVIVDNEAPFAEVTSPVRITSRGGEVFSTNGEVRVYFPPGAFSREVVVRVDPPGPGAVPQQLPDEAGMVWEGMAVSWDGEALLKTGTLDLRVPGTPTGKPRVYTLLSGGAWEFLGGTWNPGTSTLSLPLRQTGLYAVFSGGTESTTLPPGLIGLTLTPRILDPSSPPLTIGFSLQRPGPVTVRVFNRAGRLIRRVVDGTYFDSGVHAVHWDGRSENGEAAVDGLYLISIEGQGQQEVKTVSVVR